jgi:hypothetical protein
MGILGGPVCSGFLPYFRPAIAGVPHYRARALIERRHELIQRSARSPRKFQRPRGVLSARGMAG